MTGTETEVLEPLAAASAESSGVGARPSRAFLWWGGGFYLATLLATLVRSLRESDGHLIYLIDDPAIHLGIAQNLLHHGTWGVVPGQFQSASSSPLWTLGLTAASGVAPFAATAAPLVLNVGLALAVIALFGHSQRVLTPGWRRPLDVVAVGVLIVVVLYLPALTMLGMEHILHLLLVLLVVLAVQRRLDGEPQRWSNWTLWVLVALAMLARFETGFVVIGIVAAIAVRALPGSRGTTPTVPLERAVRLAIGVSMSAGAALVTFAVFSRLMGNGWLPNSIVTKATGLGVDRGISVKHSLETLQADPLLTVLFAACLAATVLGWRERRRWLVPSVVVVVATILHVTLADVGWFARYQAYLIALAVLALLQVADECRDWLRTGKDAAVPVLVICLLLFSYMKFENTKGIATQVASNYLQRYQVARFLAENYDGEPVATSELGYVSLKHRGPLTDLLGLGDYEVLQNRKAHGGRLPAAYLRELARRRGFKVVAMYEHVLADRPPEWTLVGRIVWDHPAVTALGSHIEIYAVTASQIPILQHQLARFARHLPSDTTVRINEYAQLQAKQPPH